MKKIQNLKQFHSWAFYNRYMQLLTWLYFYHICRFKYIKRKRMYIVNILRVCAQVHINSYICNVKCIYYIISHIEFTHLHVNTERAVHI